MLFGAKKQISFAIYSDIGKRAVNEDSVRAMKKGDNFCFVVCDGLGGHGMGDTASQTVVASFEKSFDSMDKISEFLGKAFEQGQDDLLAEQKKRHAEKKMKTTGVAFATDGKKAYIGHIGDSRGYIFNNNKVLKRTIDHSVPQMLALSHDIKESEIRNHPDRSIVLRVMGNVWENKQYELIKPISLSKCQAFLLCTDGFWELIEEDEMCALLEKAESAQEWLTLMANVVREHGKDINMDNNSAIAVWCS